MNNALINCFNDTLNLCKNNELKALTEKSRNSTKVYFENFTAEQIKKGETAEISVEDTTTFSAAAQYHHLGKVAVLNFANPEVPGGGVKNGATAQEECLCRCSNLYPCLTSQVAAENFYKYHHMFGRFFYSDRVIYTKNVTVFKSEDLKLLDRNQWFNVDVLTCAAPLLVKIKTYISKTALCNFFKSRIKNIFNVALENNIDVLILGAFGCGAFKNPPDVVAKAFKEVVFENGYNNCFKKIIFAIKNSNNNDPYDPCPNLMEFERAFYGVSVEANELRINDGYSLEFIKLPSGKIIKSPEKCQYFEWQNSNKFNGKLISILGDSISTLDGYNPDEYNLFFTGKVCQESGVANMADTWWGQVIEYLGAELLVNNSWSGSRVTKLLESDTLFPSGCSDERTGNLHAADTLPDIIIIYLGLNDWANGVTPNNTNLENNCSPKWDEFQFSYNAMIEKIKHNYPKAEIWCCTLCSSFMSLNPYFSFPEKFCGIHIEKYNDIIRLTAQNQNCKLIDLYSYNIHYDSIDGIHPNKAGMCTLALLILRETLDCAGARFLDCEKEHEYIINSKRNFVCKKCGKTISSYNYYKYNFPALRDEYINRNKAKTAELFPGVLKLTNLNSNEKNEFVANSISLRIRNNCAVFFYTVDSSVASYADFLYENKIWYLRDNNSQNGTWLNGKRILPNKKYELCSGDEIDFAGKEIFAFYKK